MKDNNQEEIFSFDDQQELLEIISILQNNFNPTDINDYRTTILILYNSLFLQENNLTSELKYKIYGLIDTAINRTEEYMQHTNNHKENRQIRKEDIINMIYTKVLPYYMQNGIVTRGRGERGICS